MSFQAIKTATRILPLGRDTLIACFTVAAVTLICLPLSRVLLPSNLGAFYLLAICCLAPQVSQVACVLASALGAACFDFFFISPYHSLGLHDPEYILTFCSLLAVSVIISGLTTRAQAQAKAALEREQETHTLLDFSRNVGGCNSPQEVYELFAQQLRQRGHDLSPEVLHNSEESLESLAWLPQLDTPQRRLLEGLARLTQLALERQQLVQQARQSEVLAATRELQSALLNCVSHDLRTPLVAIKGALETLQCEGEAHLNPADRKLLLRNAIRESDRLSRFVGNLMNMNRLESGHLNLRLEAQDLTEIVEETVHRSGYPQRVSLALPAELLLVKADYFLLQQVLWNLLDNAFKFSGDSPVEVGACPEGTQSIRLWVRDWGPGIPIAQQELVFERFFRGYPEIVGSGLGLPICRGLIEAMGGSIWVEQAQPGVRLCLRLAQVRPDSALDGLDQERTECPAASPEQS